MNLGPSDMKIVIVFGGAIVVMSLLFPALGMAGTEQTASDVPQFDINTSKFDFVDDIPPFPSNPGQGVLNASSDKFDDSRGNIQVELGEGSDGNRTFLVSNTSGGVWITDVEENTIDDDYVFTSDGETATLEGQGFTIDVHAADLSGDYYEWIITERPEDQTFLGGLPLIGGFASSLDQVASVVAWLGQAFIVGSMIVSEAALNTGGATLDFITFWIDLGGWLVDVWFNSVDSAPGYAKVILTVTAVPLFWVFSKMVAMTVSLISPLS